MWTLCLWNYDFIHVRQDKFPGLWLGKQARLMIRIWCQSQRLHERQLHSENFVVECAGSSQSVVGSFFFEDANANVTGYTALLRGFFVPALHQDQLESICIFIKLELLSIPLGWVDFLRETFPDRLIFSERIFIGLPGLRGPDSIKSCNGSHIGYLKDRVCYNRI